MKINEIDSDLIINDDYFNEYDKHVICSICLNVMNNPHCCSGCDNKFCFRCISSAKFICPMRCQSTFSLSNIIHRKILAKLQFVCPKECNDIIYYNDYIEHANFCEGKQDTCPICSSRVNKSKINCLYSDATKELEETKKIAKQLEDKNKELSTTNNSLLNKNKLILDKNEESNKLLTELKKENKELTLMVESLLNEKRQVMAIFNNNNISNNIEDKLKEIKNRVIEVPFTLQNKQFNITYAKTESALTACAKINNSLYVMGFQNAQMLIRSNNDISYEVHLESKHTREIKSIILLKNNAYFVSFGIY